MFYIHLQKYYDKLIGIEPYMFVSKRTFIEVVSKAQSKKKTERG